MSKQTKLRENAINETRQYNTSIQFMTYLNCNGTSSNECQVQSNEYPSVMSLSRSTGDPYKKHGFVNLKVF